MHTILIQSMLQDALKDMMKLSRYMENIQV